MILIPVDILIIFVWKQCDLSAHHEGDCSAKHVRQFYWNKNDFSHFPFAVLFDDSFCVDCIRNGSNSTSRWYGCTLCTCRNAWASFNKFPTVFSILIWPWHYNRSTIWNNLNRSQPKLSWCTRFCSTTNTNTNWSRSFRVSYFLCSSVKSWSLFSHCNALIHFRFLVSMLLLTVDQFMLLR